MRSYPPLSRRPTAWSPLVPSRRACPRRCCVWSECQSAGQPRQNLPASPLPARIAERLPLTKEGRKKKQRHLKNLLLSSAFASTPWRKNTLYNEWSHKWTPIPSVCKMICRRRLQRSLIPLISLWIFFSECRYSRPFRISLRIVAIWVSSRGPGSIFQETKTAAVEVETVWSGRGYFIVVVLNGLKSDTTITWKQKKLFMHNFRTNTN